MNTIFDSLGARDIGENTGLQVRTLVEATALPIGLKQIKDHLRVDFKADDFDIEEKIRTVWRSIEAFANISLVRETYQAHWDTYAREVPIPNGPIKSISEVKTTYAGTDTVLTTAQYNTQGLDFVSVFPDIVCRGSVGALNYNLAVTYKAGYAVPVESIATDTLTVTAHGFSNGDTVPFTGISTASVDALAPESLVFNKTYYVVEKTDDTLKLSLTSGGAAISTTTAGIGTFFIGKIPDIALEVLKRQVSTNYVLREDEIAGTSSGDVSVLDSHSRKLLSQLKR